jgi:hypothetical protein
MYEFPPSDGQSKIRPLPVVAGLVCPEAVEVVTRMLLLHGTLALLEKTRLRDLSRLEGLLVDLGNRLKERGVEFEVYT